MIKKIFAAERAKNVRPSKIAIRLSLNFGAALLIFSIIIGGVFILLFRNHTLDIHKAELKNKAQNIAETFSSYMDRGMGMGYGAYLRIIGDIAGTDVWIVDKKHNLLTNGRRHGMMSEAALGYSDLPQNAEQIIAEVFTDKTVFSEDFSGLMSELTLTVGVPIKNGFGGVVGVALLHSPVHGINDAISQGITILALSILAALFISSLLSIIFSYSFTKPLSKMKNTALKLASGDYTAKNEIYNNDEIGQLAGAIDILADRLDTASKQSAQLEQMRRDFVANVSHELKTPVTVMRGSLEALVDGVVTDPDMVSEYYEQMLKEAKYLQRLVGDLLDLTRLQNSDFIIEKSEISICECLGDVVRSVAKLAEKKGVSIKVTKSGNMCKLSGDYGRIRQMLLIVLDNAIKFSPEGKAVEIALNEKTLSIKDYGCGIANEHLPYIFERFYTSRSEQNKTGTGLGLAIAKQIADRHGIGLLVQSASGEGATFLFTFEG